MFDPISGLQGIQSTGDLRILSAQSKPKAEEEFLALFYKELLKQVFTPPKFGLENEDNSSFSNTFTSDLLVEKMALELARKQAFSAGQLFPDIVQERTKLND